MNRVVREVEAQAAVDQTEEEDGRTEVFVDLGEIRWRLGLLPDSMV